MPTDNRKITVRKPCSCSESRVYGPFVYGLGGYPKKQRCLDCGGWLGGERLRRVQERALSARLGQPITLA